MACKNHQFIPMGETVKYPKLINTRDTTGGIQYDAIAPVRPKHGMKAGCVLCGEIRAIYDDGELEVIHAPSNEK